MSAGTERNGSASRMQSQQKAIYYGLAVMLPCLCSCATIRLPLLYGFPLALHFLAIMVVAIVGGVGPGICTLVMSMVARVVQGSVSLPPLTPLTDVFRFAILALEALLLGVLTQRRRRSEERLHSALADLQDRTDDLIASLSNSKCACWTIDLASGKSARWFRGSYPIFGRPYEEVEALPSLRTLLHEEDGLRLPELAEQMRSSAGPIVWEYRCTWPNGEVHTLEMRASRVSTDRPVWRGVTLDITERKTTELALMRVEKLAAMGRLASTVAHEINNPLEAVTNLLYLARADETLAPATREYLRTAERELSRLSNITRLTLGFVRVGGTAAAVEVATVVEEVLSIFQHRLEARHVRVQRRFEAGVRVMMAPHELRQIATNLIANAADAVNGGMPAIALRITQEGDLAVLVVEDNGDGIAPADLVRIFEAFFSTKPDVGTGIGLWVSKELAEKNGGRITVESVLSPLEMDGGMRTRFRVELPVAAAGLDALPE